MWHFRLSPLLLDGHSVRECYDLQSRADLWKEESSYLYLYLLDRRLCIGHVSQGFWNCSQAHPSRKQPVHTSFDLRIRHFSSSLHFDADELLQQGPQPISNLHVSSVARSDPFEYGS